MPKSGLYWVCLLAVAGLLLAPRLTQLDRFVNVDETRWLARSANFYRALATRNWHSTYQKEHPGVVVTWAGTAGYLALFPGLAQAAPAFFDDDRPQLEHFLRQQGYHELDLLIAGRVALIILGISALLLAFGMVARLAGVGSATVAFLLIAFDPFHIALMRMLHVDAPEANFMFLALVAWLAYLLLGRQRRDLVIAAIAAGLAWLTKVPALFLAPFFGLLILIEIGLHWRRDRSLSRSEAGTLVSAGVLWGAIGFAVVFALWPVMWVDPIGTARRVVEHAFVQASGHVNAVYFEGEVIERFTDPGFQFYPVTWLWRTTPVTLAGTLLGLVALCWPQAFRLRTREQRTLGYLWLFALTFLLFMNLSNKRFDRYLLPIYLPLDVVAGVAWAVMLRRLASNRLWQPRTAGAIAGGVLLVAGQASFSLPIAPHFMAYYNPLLGGGAKAPAVMMIGWGEGLDEAGRYLNTKPDAANLQVAAWYALGSFSYFFSGRKVEEFDYTGIEDVGKWLDTDYFVTYIHQWQRRLPEERLVAHFAAYQPEHEIVLNDIPYAQIYPRQNIPPPPYLAPGRAQRFVDWGEAIRLLGYHLPTTPLQPGAEFKLEFLLQGLAPMEHNYNILVRVVDGDGRELLRAEGWPWGTPTNHWAVGEIWPDGHSFQVPAGATPGVYRVEVNFYDPATLEPLPASDALTGEQLAGAHIVDTVTVETAPLATADNLAAMVTFGELYQLAGVEEQPVAPVRPGEAVTITLAWSAVRPPRYPLQGDYSSFVHLVAPGGQLVAQRDVAPPVASVPPRLWQPGQVVRQRYELVLPKDAAPGVYGLLAGLYNRTGRLPVSVNGQATGDTFRFGELSVDATGPP